MDTAVELNILVIDDDLGDRKNLRRAIKRSALKASTFEADGIHAALAVLQNERIDCIFIDYNMPLFDGLEGIVHLKKHAPNIPLVMVTGQGDELLATKAIQRGASDYIPKRLVGPDTVEKVTVHVMEIAALERRIREQQDAVANFSRMLAHDLKAPVRHIRIVGETMAQAIAAAEIDRVGELFVMMQKMVDRIGLLVTTLDEYNRSLSPNVVFDTIKLQPVLEGALENLQLEIDAAGARITHDTLPDVHGNEALLTQLFQNLIGNAVKFCKREAPHVHITAREGDAAVQVSVTDNGIGIAENALNTVFEPFRRLNPVGEFAGTGLGLATCRKILDRHGGDIWCESAPGEGSTFHFTLKRPAA